MPIRNTSVAQGMLNTPNVYTNIYTVPAGNALILKSVLLDYTGSATTSAQLVLNGGGINMTLINQSMATGALFSWGGWTVLNAGHGIYVVTSVAGLEYWIAGAVLPYASP